MTKQSALIGSGVLAAPEELVQRKIILSKHRYRGEFMRDRDRILYSKAFRRLSGKTQVFESSFDDHARTRLTHTLEVAQIARTIAGYLGLDSDLTEAIALGHDLGHTPFGHVGERTLNLAMNGCSESFRRFFDDNTPRGFKHNLQSVRVAVDLEQPLVPHPGLNLSNFTLFGFKAHSSESWIKKNIQTGQHKPCVYANDGQCGLHPLKPQKCKGIDRWEVNYYDQYTPSITFMENGNVAWSFEAYVVKWSDEIAQRHHDLEDALRGNLMAPGDVIDLLHDCFSTFFLEQHTRNFQSMKEAEWRNNFDGEMSRFIVDLLVDHFLDATEIALNAMCEDYDIESRDDFVRNFISIDQAKAAQAVGLNKDVMAADDAFQDKMKDIILNSYQVQRMDGKGRYIINRLFEAYLTNPQQLNDDTIISVFQIYDPELVEELRTTENSRISGRIGQIRNQLEKKRHLSEPEFQQALLRSICDYISSMTDAHAMKEYHQLYG